MCPVQVLDTSWLFKPRFTCRLHRSKTASPSAGRFRVTPPGIKLKTEHCHVKSAKQPWVRMTKLCKKHPKLGRFWAHSTKGCQECQKPIVPTTCTVNFFFTQCMVQKTNTLNALVLSHVGKPNNTQHGFWNQCQNGVVCDRLVAQWIRYTASIVPLRRVVGKMLGQDHNPLGWQSHLLYENHPSLIPSPHPQNAIVEFVFHLLKFKPKPLLVINATDMLNCYDTYVSYHMLTLVD